MICPSCKATNTSPGKFCTTCGALLGDTALPRSVDGTLMDDEPPAADGAVRGLGESCPLAASGTRAGGQKQYVVEEIIGRGGMSVVYRALDTRLRRNVAIKRLLPQYAKKQKAVDRLMSEARAIARLSHPGIVAVYDVDEDAEGPYVAMEYVTSILGVPESLQDRVKPPNRAARLFSPEVASKMVLKLAEAVAHAHEAGIIHRDIKPSNVLLTVNGEPKLVDFGIAHVHDGKTEGLDLTSETATLGTPDYMAPEQEGDARNVDERADVYGLGGILHFCLTGFSTRYFRESSLPVSLRGPVARAVDHDRDRRWRTVADFSNALHSAMASPDVVGAVVGSAKEALKAIAGAFHGGAATASAPPVVASVQAEEQAKTADHQPESLAYAYLTVLGILILLTLVVAPLRITGYLALWLFGLTAFRDVKFPGISFAEYEARIIGFLGAVGKRIQAENGPKVLLVIAGIGLLLTASVPLMLSAAALGYLVLLNRLQVLGSGLDRGMAGLGAALASVKDALRPLWHRPRLRIILSAAAMPATWLVAYVAAGSWHVVAAARIAVGIVAAVLLLGGVLQALLYSPPGTVPAPGAESTLPPTEPSGRETRIFFLHGALSGWGLGLSIAIGLSVIFFTQTRLFRLDAGTLAVGVGLALLVPWLVIAVLLSRSLATGDSTDRKLLLAVGLATSSAAVMFALGGRCGAWLPGVREPGGWLALVPAAWVWCGVLRLLLIQRKNGRGDGIAETGGLRLCGLLCAGLFFLSSVNFLLYTHRFGIRLILVVFVLGTAYWVFAVKVLYGRPGVRPSPAAADV